MAVVATGGLREQLLRAVLTVWRRGTDRGEKWQGQNTKHSIVAFAALQSS